LITKLFALTVDSFLAKYTGKKVFLRSFAGNGGDALLLVAAHLAFEKHAVNYHMADESVLLDNEIVFIRGGGNLVTYYNHIADFIKQRCSKVKELIILPHTISGHEDILSRFDSRVTVFCREQVSLDYVKSFQNIVNVHIDDDMAFGLKVRDIFPTLPAVRYLFRTVKLRRLIGGVLKGKTSIGLYAQKRGGDTLFAFRTDSERTEIELPKKNVDVSEVINLDPTMGDVDLAFKTSAYIFGLIDQYETIHTNRLHIGIAALLLEKELFFHGNAYHKNKSVYDFSINQRFHNVTWTD
jgi:exopolysaccharide biosynthesis predicted pyruvyltransferase EpsI